MSATFEITINAVYTSDINGMSNAVKHVAFNVRGLQQGQQFNLPQNVDLGDPDSAAFKAFSELTEADVVAWVEANFSQMDSVKAHIQHALDRQIAEASLQAKPMPWQPEPAPVTPPPIPTPAV
jgi:hypothetical protein